jgi:predicted ArsR family transcriptional regulator
MSFQSQLVELLKEEKSATVVKIASNLGASVGYVRTQLKALEYAGTIERVDDRTPIYYQLSPTSPVAIYAQEVKEAKDKLMNGNSKNELIKFLKEKPKSEWEHWAMLMDICSQAIKELKSEDRLVDTL